MLYNGIFKYDETKVGCTNFMKGVASLEKYITEEVLKQYDFSGFVYHGAHISSEVICRRCNAVLTVSPVNIRNGKGCRDCNFSDTINKRKKKKEEEIISKLISRHGSKFDYTKVVYNKSTDKIIITCRIHDYQFESTYMNHLRNDSGGCHKCESENMIKVNTTHGKRKHRLYNIWSGMKARCLNVNSPAYKRYGGRSISICEEWLNFKKFFDWAMSNGYRDDFQIDRIDNDKGYNEDNCRFVSSKKNGNNKSTNHFVEIEGQKKTLQEWCELFEISPKTACKRISRGWEIETAIKTPICKYLGVNKKYRLVEPLWSGIKNRCNNEKSSEYKNYGGRGIRVCQKWAEDYKCFEDWCLNNGYKKGLHLHRINNDEGYFPSNCKFVTPMENAQHKTSNRYLIYRGVRKTLSQYARQFGLKRETVSGRLKRGYTVEEALTLSLRAKRTRS